jgi:hypothetical protein
MTLAKCLATGSSLNDSGNCKSLVSGMVLDDSSSSGKKRAGSKRKESETRGRDEGERGADDCAAAADAAGAALPLDAALIMLEKVDEARRGAALTDSTTLTSSSLTYTSHIHTGAAIANMHSLSSIISLTAYLDHLNIIVDDHRCRRRWRRCRCRGGRGGT